MDGLKDQNDLPEPGIPAQASGRDEKDGKVLVLPVNEDSRKITQILSNETSLKILELLGSKSMSASKIAEELQLPLTTVKYNLDSLVESDLIKVTQIKWSQKGRQVKIYESAEKLIVLVPSKSSLDKLSLTNLLQKYLGVIGAAFFAAAGIEYFSMYMQAKRIVDATAPLRTPIPQANESVPAETVLATNDTEPITEPMSQKLPESSVMEDQANVSSTKALEVGTENSSLDTGVGGGVSDGTAEVNASTQNASGPIQSIPPVPHEGLANAGGFHGLYDVLAQHPGIWFLFGCIFIVFLLIVKEVYFKKKSR